MTNTGTTATSSWTVTLTFANGQQITQIWGGRTTQTASPYIITPESWNAVPPAQRLDLGRVPGQLGTHQQRAHGELHAHAVTR